LLRWRQSGRLAVQGVEEIGFHRFGVYLANDVNGGRRVDLLPPVPLIRTEQG
jgi:hypothetical protein